MHVFEGCEYDVKMSLNTWLFTFVNKFILFLYKVHKLLMILCILAVVHVTVHDTCMDSCV